MTLRLTAISAIILATAIVVSAQSDTTVAAIPTIVGKINASGNITVTLPEALASRLGNQAQASSAEEGSDETGKTSSATATNARAGYRIQIFDDNNPRTARSEAQSKRSMVLGRFPEWQAYVSYNSPYWRVKVGDFRSRSEAEAALAELRQAFPGLSRQMRIVRDRINTAE